MAITIDDFNKIWASTSPLTPYTFSDANYRQGWNFVGATPPSRQMWDSWLKMTDEKCQYLYNHEDVPVGHEYFTFNPNIPQGSLPLFGGEYSRETYSALWNWVQEQTGYLKTEAEWQTLSTANNGNVPYYSSGDGSTTFRVPSLKCWVKAADGTVSEVGSYKAAGLPNITGSFITRKVKDGSTYYAGVYDPVGSFNATGSGSVNAGVVAIASGTDLNQKVDFDASRSSSIYGDSTTVQPESIVGMWLVKAYGTIVDTGQIDEQQYIDDRIAALPNTFLPLAGGTMSGDISFPTQVWDNDYVTSYQTAKTLTSRYGIKGHMPTDRRVFYTLAMARDDSNKPSSDETCRFATLETAVGNNGNPNVYLRMYKNVENSTDWSQLQMYWDSNDKAGLNFDGREVERVNASGSNYIRYESGIQICWGYASTSSDGIFTVTFSSAFINTSYAMNVTGLPATTGTASSRMTSLSTAGGDKTTTSWKGTIVNASNVVQATSVVYIAIGLWK